MKTIYEFIEEHRAEIKAGIQKYLNFVPRTASCNCPKSRTDHYHDDGRELDDEELRVWILNDEGLYRWALSERVDI